MTPLDVLAVELCFFFSPRPPLTLFFFPLPHTSETAVLRLSTLARQKQTCSMNGKSMGSNHASLGCGGGSSVVPNTLHPHTCRGDLPWHHSLLRTFGLAAAAFCWAAHKHIHRLIADSTRWLWERGGRERERREAESGRGGDTKAFWNIERAQSERAQSETDIGRETLRDASSYALQTAWCKTYHRGGDRR